MIRRFLDQPVRPQARLVAMGMQALLAVVRRPDGNRPDDDVPWMNHR
jgi:hypothetical protein